MNYATHKSKYGDLKMEIKDICFSWLMVKDFKKAKDFYVDTLGLTISEFNENFNWMELGTQEKPKLMGVGQDTENSPSFIKAGQNAVIAITVANIETAKRHMEEKGVFFEGDILEIPGQVKMALFLDPDGNKLQLVEDLNPTI